MVQFVYDKAEINRQLQKNRFAIQLIREVLKNEKTEYENYYIHTPEGELISFDFAFQVFLNLQEDNLHPKSSNYSLTYIKCCLLVIQEVLEDYADCFQSCYIPTNLGEYITFESAKCIYEDLCDSL